VETGDGPLIAGPFLLDLWRIQRPAIPATFPQSLIWNPKSPLPNPKGTPHSERRECAAPAGQRKFFGTPAFGHWIFPGSTTGAIACSNPGHQPARKAGLRRANPVAV